MPNVEVELNGEAAGAALQKTMAEMTGLRQALHDAIDKATADRADADGHPVDPRVLVGLLMMEAGKVALMHGIVQDLRPEEIVSRFDDVLRHARRGFRVQLSQAMSGGEPQKRIVTT